MFLEFHANSHISISKLDYSIQFQQFISFLFLIPLIFNSFDLIYDRDPPESQFDYSHQATRENTINCYINLRIQEK